MEVIPLESSSEEDDGYLNSVAKLKALKKQSSTLNSKNTKPVEEIAEISITEPTGCATRKQTRKQRGEASKSVSRPSRRKQRVRARNEDSDLEIVSVEEISGLHKHSSEDDLEIVETRNEASSEDENYDINIKILWQSKNVHRFNIRRNENFLKIYEYFASLEGISLDEILITRKDKTVQRTDTPASINLSVIDILEGGVVKRALVKLQQVSETKADENTSIIKIQTTSKKSLTISVKKNQDFTTLFSKCAEELNLEKSKIKLYFDGELISAADTPDSLEIEEAACFDLRIVS